MTEGFALAQQQRRLWQYAEARGSVPYNVLYARLGDVEESVVRRAVEITCSRHEIFAVKLIREAVFKFPQQHVQDAPRYRFERRDIFGTGNLEQFEQDLQTYFQQSDPEPAVFVFLAHDDGRKSLLIGTPCMYADVRSLSILLQDVCRCCAVLANGADAMDALNNDQIQYIDYAEWQREQTAQPEFGKYSRGWRETFSENRFGHTLPFGKGTGASGNIEYISAAVDVTLADQLNEFCDRHAVSITTLVLVSWYRLLTGFDRKIVVGYKSDMRYGAELQGVVGPLEKYCPVIIDQDAGEADLITLLQRHRNDDAVKAESFDIGAYDNERVMFSYLFESITMPVSDGNVLSFECVALNGNSETYILKLILVMDGGRAKKLRIGYDQGVYTEDTVSNMLTCLVSRIVQWVSGKAEAGPSWAEREVITRLTQGKAITPAFSTILEQFSHVAAASPDKELVVFNGHSLSCHTVQRLSDQWADVLKQTWKIQPGAIVAIHVKRSEKLIPLLLAVLKAGACYLPMDVHVPDGRKALIVDDAKPALIMLDEHEPWATGFTAVTIDTLVNAEKESDAVMANTVVAPESIAYIIYTSGTTGKPKGVRVSHRALNNYVHWFTTEFNVEATDQTLLLSSVAYDLCYTALWTGIAAGATLHVLEECPYLDVEQCINTLRTAGITYLKMTPSHVKLLLGNAAFLDVVKTASLRMLVLGGEPIQPADIEKILRAKPALQIVNHYGPTETTIGTVAFPLQAETFGGFSRNPVIGRPIYNAIAYSVEPGLEPVPVGEPGELYIAGPGVAEGYLNRDELTRERFVKHPVTGARMYRTGDIVRLWPDGTLAFVGRSDHQVKIRGNRVELEEIEATVSAFGGVQRCVVTIETKQNEEQALFAYVQTDPGITPEVIVAHLQHYLPAYMIPESVIVLDQLPLNANGKVARASLSHITFGTAHAARTAKPVTETERQLVAIWKAVLERDAVGVDDSFFRIGGHSLLATKLVARIASVLHVKVSLKNIFDLLTVRDLAAFIDTMVSDDAVVIRPIRQQLYYEVSPAQRQVWMLTQLSADPSVFNIPKAYGIAGSLNGEVFDSAIHALVERHESLRTTFVEVNQEPRQVIHNTGALPEFLFHYDFSAAEDVGQKVFDLIRSESNKPFDLVRGPLFRVYRINVSDTHSVFLYTVHHIIADAWSKEIIWKEFNVLYDAFINGKPNPLPPLAIQYKDYVAWLGSNLREADAVKAQNYWADTFRRLPEPLNLPLDYVRPDVKTANGNAIRFVMSDETSNGLAERTRTHNVSLFTMLMAGLTTLLYRYTNQTDIVIGTPVSGRTHDQLHHQVGLYINNLAIRTILTGSNTFEDLIMVCRDNILMAFEHQAYPFDTLLEHIGYKRDFSRSPLYDVVLVLGSNDFSGEVSATPGISDLDLKAIKTGFRKSIVDLRFVFIESTEGIIHFLIEYNTDLFKEQTIAQMGAQLITVLNTVVKNADVKLNEISFATTHTEEQSIVVDDETVEETFNFSF